MKYNIKYYTLLFALVLSFASCDLDRFPEDKISTPTFWKSENDVRLALMGRVFKIALKIPCIFTYSIDALDHQI